MDEPVKTDIPQKEMSARFYSWFNKRTGIRNIMRASLDEPIPGGARWAYIFGSGLLFIFISQVITGLCLALYYVPSAGSAHTSVAYITKEVTAGDFLRSLHYYGSSAMIIVLLLHFLQTFLYGSFKGRRELLWIVGAFLSFLVLGMGFTGYLLPWDQSSYFATAVGTNIVGEVPLIGQWLTDMLRGGDTLGTLTLSRFYFAHVFLIPAMIFLFIGLHIALFRKAGAAGPIDEDPIHPQLPPESFYPRQVIMDMAFAMLLMVGLGFLAYFHPVQLGPIANPANTQFVPRPEWYYLPMFEWLKFWPGRLEALAIIGVPGSVALLFFLVPFLDRKLERRPWRRPIPLLAVTIVLVGTIFLGIKSHLDDLHDPTVATQLAFQSKQAEDYTKTPFRPRMESATGELLSSGPVNPLVAKGKQIFDTKGCSGCHGESAAGTAVAPGLVKITSTFSLPQITALLRNPNAKMRAGGMPAFDFATPDMTALYAYLSSLNGGSPSSSPAESTSTAPPATAPSIPAAATPPPATSSANTANRASSPSPKEAAGATSVSAAAGEKVFEAHACFACHGQAGVGTARVPPLAGLVAGQSDQQLLKLVEHPNAKMRAGGMPPSTGSQAEESSLIAYIRSLAPAKQAKATQKPATAAAPAKKTAAAASVPAPSTKAPAQRAAAKSTPAATTTSPVTEGRAVFEQNGCAACHGPTAHGTQFAPSLVGVTRKFPGDKLPYLLRHPNARMRAGGMPTFNLSDTQMQHLVAYLSSLNTAPPAAHAPSASTSTAQPGSRATAATHAAAVARAPLTPLELRGQQIFQRNGCEACHGVGGLHGTVAAPALAGTASLLPASVLENLLRHHTIRMQQGGMPLTNMNYMDMKALIAYIRSMPTPAGAQ